MTRNRSQIANDTEGIFGDAPLGTDASRRAKKHRSYEELQRVIGHLDMAGRSFSASTVGTSRQGRDIQLVSIGSGNTDVMIIGQQHGSESTGSTTLLALLHYLGSGECDSYLDDVTVHVIPRANPDGTAVGARGTVDPEAPNPNADEGIFTLAQPVRGWDPNRYHFPDWSESRLYQHHPEDYPENPVQVSRIITEVVEQINPTWFVDVHGQQGKTTENGKPVNQSVMWPVLGNKPLPPDGLALSKRMCVHVYDHLRRINQTVSRYPATADYPGVAHKAYALQNRGSIIFESVEPKSLDSYWDRTLACLPSLLSLIGATATGELYSLDPNRTAEIPSVR